MTAEWMEVQNPLGRVLIVDDNLIATESLRQALQGVFEVETINSGEDCLQHLATELPPPDLILLDIEMGGIDGFETCLQLRQTHSMPVIFVSSHDDLAERIKAFDSGGDDFIVKPFEPELVQRKAQRIVELRATKAALAAEKDSLQTMAMGFLRNIGDTGVLLTFMRSSLSLVDYEQLALRLIEATAEYGVLCHVQVRHAGGSCTMTPNGRASPLEESVLERSSTMGRIFQFGRRMVVNYTYISILILDLPDDDTKVGELRDNIAILAESAEAISETIGIRKESALRAEALQVAANETTSAVVTLRDYYLQQQRDARQRLQEMIDNVEKGYFNLGLTDRQEGQISDFMRTGADNTLELFDVSDGVEKRFTQILNALQPKTSAASQTDVWL